MTRPMLEDASVVWGPHQQHLTNSIEAVQRRAARRIYRDFSHHTSATELVNKLQLQTLSERKTVSNLDVQNNEWPCG